MATRSLQATIFGVDKASPAFEKVGQSATQMADQASGASDRMGQSWSKASKAVAVAGAAMVAAVLVKGWNRLTGIENAQAKLKGLGHSADEVTQIMNDALASVKGTAFGLGDAATVAANAVASGIKPGKDLEKTLRLIADSAAIAGTDLGSMGSIFNKVAANGKLTGDVMQQLLDQGIPVLKFLSDQLGVTQSDVRKMVSAGTIDFDTFSKAMEKGVGGSAIAMGNTTTGALMNMSAAAGRFGAELLQDVQPMVKGFADGAISAFDAIGPPVKSMVNVVMGIPGPVKAATVAFAAFKLVQHTSAWGKLTTAMAGFRDEMALQKGLAKMSGQEISSMGAAATVAGGKMRAFGKTLAKGGILAGGILLITNIVGEFGKVSAMQDQVVDGQKSIADALTTSNGKWTEQVQLAQNAAIEGTDFFKAASAAGIGYQTIIMGLTGTESDYNKLQDAVVKSKDFNTASTWKQVDALRGQRGASEDLYTEQQRTIKQQEAQAAAQVKSTRLTADYRDAMDDAKTSAHDFGVALLSQSDAQDVSRAAADSSRIAWAGQGDAQDAAKRSALDWASAAGKVPDTLGNMTGALKTFADQTSAADTRLQFFTMSVDALAGRNVSLEEATKLLNDETRNLKDGFTEATKATKKHLESLIETDGQINTTTEAGSKLYDTVTNYRKAYDTATEAAVANGLATGTSTDAIKAGRAAADDARATFLKQAAALKINKTDAEKLADAMGILEGKKLSAKTMGVYVADQATTKVAQINALKLDDKSFTAWVKMATTNEQLFGGGRESRGKAGGGAITGSGKGVDSQLHMLAPGEHVLTSGDVDAMGGQGNVYRFRSSLHGGFGMASGGGIGDAPTVMSLSGMTAPTIGGTLGNVLGGISQFRQVVTNAATAARDAAIKTKDLSGKLHELEGRTKKGTKGTKEQIATASRALVLAEKESGAARNRADVLTKLSAASGVWTTHQKRAAIALDATNVALDTATSKLTALKSAAAQMSDSISSGIAAGASLSSMWGDGSTVDSLVSGMSAAATATMTFGSNLKTLSSKGIGGDLLSQLAQGGLNNSGLVSSLASSTGGQVSQIKSLYDQITSSAAATGKFVSNAAFGDQIVAQSNKVDALVKTQTDLQHQLRVQAEKLQSAISAGMSGVAGHVVDVQRSVDLMRVSIDRLPVRLNQRANAGKN